MQRGAAAVPGAAGAVPARGARPYFKGPDGRYINVATFMHPTGRPWKGHCRSTKISFATIRNDSVNKYKPLTPRKEAPPRRSSSSASGGSTSKRASSGWPIVGGKDANARRDRSSSVESTQTLPEKQQGVQTPAAAPRPLREDLYLTRPEDSTYILFNVADSVFFYEHLSAHENRVPIEQLKFKTDPLCHMIDADTAGEDGVNVLVGFATGDHLVHDSLHKTFSQVKNKDGFIDNGKVVAATWVPRSQGPQYVAAHDSGCLLVYDKTIVEEERFPPLDPSKGFHVTQRAKSATPGNPLERWYIGAKATAMAFSPDCRNLAITARDGTLTVYSWEQRKPLVRFHSFFGALRCLAWSPDSRYILTGGEDDMLTLWSFVDRCCVARCEGHTSWIGAVAFDFFTCQPGEQLYRFGSVGEDCYLMLWEFSPLTLPRPSVIPQDGLPDATRDDMGVLDVPSIPMNQVSAIDPLFAYDVHAEPLSDLHFLEDVVFTACMGGVVKVWARPRVIHP